MDSALRKDIEQLRLAPMATIRARYRDVFGEEPRSHNRVSLFRRLTWRLQALNAGGLSETARQRALEIANEADVRVIAPRGFLEHPGGGSRLRFDRRIPAAGAVLKRDYDRHAITVKVLADGFEHQGRYYRSLSAIATEITGTRWNGLAFFGLTGARRSSKGGQRG